MRSITSKLILAFLAVSLASLILVALLSRWNTRQEFRDFVYQRNRSELVSTLQEYYQSRGSWQGLVISSGMGQFAPMNMMHGQPLSFILTDDNGQVVLGVQGYPVGGILKRSILSDGVPIEVAGKTVGTLLVERETFPVNPLEQAFVQRTGRLLLVASLGAAALALLLGILLATNLTRPLQELTRATRAISHGNLGGQVPVRGQDEMSALATSFNQMSADLAHSTRQRKQMTADIAHELRTPLSLIIGQAEAVHDGVLPATAENFEVIRQEAERLEKLVEDLRLLSLADSGELSISLQPVAPARFLEELAALYLVQFAQKNIALEMELQPDLPLINIDPGRMTQVFTNLVDNALRYTPDGGKLLFSASRGPVGLLLTVTDSGPGLPTEELERIFDRLYRVDASRHHQQGGSGLGLTIARSLVEMQGGTIQAFSPLGQGLSIQVCLPS